MNSNEQPKKGLTSEIDRLGLSIDSLWAAIEELNTRLVPIVREGELTSQYEDKATSEVFSELGRRVESKTERVNDATRFLTNLLESLDL